MVQLSKQSPIIYGLVAWAIINIFLMGTLIASGDVQDLNNYIEIILWGLSIPALLSTKKWGAAFAVFTLIYTLSTSMGILIYYQVWLNAVRVAINVPAVIYLFKALFEGKFK